MTRRGEPRVQAGQRAGMAADHVGNHAMAETCIYVRVLIGVDEDFGDLERETLDHPLHQRTAAQFAQAFIDAAHAPAKTAGENHTGDLRRINGRMRC